MTAAPQATVPRVSVIMATYNGARFIADSIRSVLSQTWADFELVVVDDCSTDATPRVLAGFADPRLRVLRNERNLGVVGSRNRCLQAARGEYVAMLDHDDLSRPTRLARQVAWLDANPRTVLVGTDGHVMDHGRLRFTAHPRRTSPAVIAWYMLVSNPLICSSVMFRAEAARRLDPFMREHYEYADDFDLYHRMRGLGEVARLDQPLTIYRLHANNTFRSNDEAMAENAARVLEPVYRPWFGDDAPSAARLVVWHIAAKLAVPDAATLHRLGDVFARVNQAFLAEQQPAAADRALIEAIAATRWRRVLAASVRGARVGWRDLRQAQGFGAAMRPADRARLWARRLPRPGGMGDLAARIRRPLLAATPAPAARFLGRDYNPFAPASDPPPTLFMVIDTEAEFDWSGPFARAHTEVSALDSVGRGQAVFDEFGLRPIYVVDYPIATQPRSLAPLRAILERDGCEIGVHLHPWTTPPFEEEVSAHNSFAGNLPPGLEERKIATLIEAIRAGFGRAPIFYRAGRHGIGPETVAILARHGIPIDLSVLPGADLRRRGGPDFRALRAVPYAVPSGPVLTVPMTRGHVGLLAPFGAEIDSLLQIPALRPLRLPSMLSRLFLLDTLTLTPEGVTEAEQRRLIRALLARGRRQFVMHFHSPSLAPGHTPYVRSTADADAFVARLRSVLRFFFEDVGGLPGYPRDLLALAADAGGDGSLGAASIGPAAQARPREREPEPFLFRESLG